MPTVTVRYWAAAKQAAGVAEENVDAENLRDVLAIAVRRHPAAEFEAVLSRSSLLVDGVRAPAAPPGEVDLTDGSLIEVLPPFAGG